MCVDHSVLNSQKSGFWGWGGLGKVRESARSAEQNTTNWRGAPKKIWGVGAKRRRKSEELARSAKEKVREPARIAEERVRSWRGAPKSRWEAGTKCRREGEEVPYETLIMKTICCFLPNIMNKKPFMIVFIRESWRKYMFVWFRPSFLSIQPKRQHLSFTFVDGIDITICRVQWSERVQRRTRPRSARDIFIRK